MGLADEATLTQGQGLAALVLLGLVLCGLLGAYAAAVQ